MCVCTKGIFQHVQCIPSATKIIKLGGNFFGGYIEKTFFFDSQTKEGGGRGAITFTNEI